MTDTLPKVLVIVGPTAVGKSETAYLVANELGGEIVSADSRQFYRGIETGTGAPSKEWQNQIPHHFVGDAPLDRRIAAGEFGSLGRQVILKIVKSGGVPIVVGGSGLYVRALVSGLAPVPPESPETRKIVQAELIERGFHSLFKELEHVDPEYANLVSEKTPKRMIRALEVYRVSGKPFTAWHRENQPQPWCNPLVLGLERPRAELREIIDQRVRVMIASGWLEEVSRLLDSYSVLQNFPPAAKEAVGYRLLAEVIKGEKSLDEATELIVNATRQFAKRQMTWFKADKTTEWLMDSGLNAPERWAAEITRRWRKFVGESHGDSI